MEENPENKSILLESDVEKHTINMKFSDNLVDDREKGYILSAAFFAFAADQGLGKQEVLEMVTNNYDQFTGDDAKKLFNRL